MYDNKERHIILFDGVCNLCNTSVQFVIKKDKRNLFRFASLQSAAGKKLLSDFSLADNHLKTFVYIKNNKVYLRSNAALEVAKTLGRGWQLLYGFKIIPSFIRDGIYNYIAKNRYQWFGKKEVCMLPTPDLQEKFL
ncbi:MAG: thiol-disulfide oxidoreductase DCC family protein [Niabella sp.]